MIFEFMKNSSSEAEKSMVIVNDTAGTFKRISEYSELTNSKILDVQNEMSGILGVLGVLEDSSAQIIGTATEFSESSEGAAASVQELNAGLEEVSVTCDLLGQISSELDNTLNKFKITSES